MLHKFFLQKYEIHSICAMTRLCDSPRVKNRWDTRCERQEDVDGIHFYLEEVNESPEEYDQEKWSQKDFTKRQY